MTSNFLKIALRNLVKYKLHSLINIFGLAIALASAIIIFLFANNELSFDSSHKNRENIYQVYKERITPTGTQNTRDTWFPMAHSLKNEFPSIKNSVHMWESNEWLEIGENKFEENIVYANEEIFNVFTIPLISGNESEAFKEVNSVVLSKSAAEKYFGNSNPIGKTIKLGYKKIYQVTAVAEELPSNSTLQFDILVPSKSINNYEKELTNWDRSYLYTYIMLNKQSSPIELEKQFSSFVVKNWDENIQKIMKLKLTSLPELNNELNGSNKRAYILIAIAFGILLIASINFMNLTTARSIERSKEIGLRKVIGATKFSLIKQFLSESILVTFIALFIGLILTELMLPKFNNLFNLDLAINYANNFWIILQIITLGIVIGFFAGLYPSFYLSRLQPVDSLKSISNSKIKRISVQQILVTSQFAISVVLIIGTIIMWQQIDYMKNAELNIDTDQLITIPIQVSDFEDAEVAQQKLETLKNELRKNSNIKSVSSSSQTPGDWIDWFTFVFPADRDESERLRMRITVVDENYFETYGIKFLDGRNFSKNIESDKNGVILNEAALKAIGWTEINNNQFNKRNGKLNLLGVVKNYNISSLSEKVEPIFHIYRSEDNRVHNYITVKLASNNISESLKFLRLKFKELDARREFKFNFVDDNFAKLYNSEERIATIISFFSILGIMIASLGLFALTSLLVIRKRKEIGIRKVLGASTFNLVYNFSMNFLKIITVGVLISFPISFYLMDKWLSDFAFKISINPIVFIFGGGITMFIALLTSATQALKASNANPVQSIKYE